MNRILALARVVWLETLRRKDVYVLFILLGALLVALANLRAFGLDGGARYLLDVGLLFTWIFAWILTVGVTARQLPREEGTGTILSLLAEPVTRAEALLGKWLGAWSVSVAATLVFYGLTLALAAGRGLSPDLPLLAQALALHAAALAVLAALTLWFSTRLAADAAATLGLAVSAAAFVLVPTLPGGGAAGPAGALRDAIYYALPHLELFDLRHRVVHAWGPAPAGVVAGALVYGVALCVLLLTLSWLAYRRKMFARGGTAA